MAFHSASLRRSQSGTTDRNSLPEPLTGTVCRNHLDPCRTGQFRKALKGAFGVLKTSLQLAHGIEVPLRSGDILVFSSWYGNSQRSLDILNRIFVQGEEASWVGPKQPDGQIPSRFLNPCRSVIGFGEVATRTISFFLRVGCGCGKHIPQRIDVSFAPVTFVALVKMGESWQQGWNTGKT